MVKLITKQQIAYLKSGGRPINMYKSPASPITSSEGWQGNEYHYIGRDKNKYVARINSLGQWEYRQANGPSFWKAIPKGYTTTGGFKFDNNSRWDHQVYPSNEFTTRVVNNVKEMNKNSDQMLKARERANRGIVPKKSSNLADLQNALWYAGAFNGLKDRRGRDITYETAVDGIRGNITNSAIARAKELGYTVDINTGKINKVNTPSKKSTNSQKFITTSGPQAPRQVIEQATQSSSVTGVNPIRVIFDPHYSSNFPAFTALADLITGTINKGYRNVTGKGPEEYLVKNPDITDIPENQKQILIDLYRQKRERTGQEPTAFTSRDWRNLQGTYTGGNRSLIERSVSPLSYLEHSLGQWNYYKDDEGNVHAVDTYDWNDGETSAGQGNYTSIRDFMGRNGTKASETTAQREKYGRSAARRMDINLGKID